MLKKIRIEICSRQGDITQEMLDRIGAEELPPCYDDEEEEGDPDAPMEISTEGKLRVADGEVRISYEESELTGMEGATTVVSFREDAPHLVTMMRSGVVTTALVFEENNRHISAYHTPFMPFELCVHTLGVDNRLLTDGVLYLDYIIEVRGARAEHNLFEMRIYDSPDRPRDLFSH